MNKRRLITQNDDSLSNREKSRIYFEKTVDDTKADLHNTPHLLEATQESNVMAT
ncbi:hypothetical protein RI844_00510 [Thalassotalea fonticola]|uniref:Uncharacterized protein n=1 Tax=Thalassotalea fonticola TaxID=3065649 RepID=A0ABZ0GP91_9GAMM|nr:hypothetical protein RI844_00510 [Colwelliaceae bacterium S1-1]